MSSFEECLDHLDSFESFLTGDFNGAAVCLRVMPIHKTCENDGESYGYVVTFERELTDEEAQKFPIHYQGIPVASHTASRGYSDRMKDFDLE